MKWAMEMGDEMGNKIGDETETGEGLCQEKEGGLTY